MAILFSNEFNIPEEDLRDLGAFNVFLDEDSHFFINENCKCKLDTRMNKNCSA